MRKQSKNGTKQRVLKISCLPFEYEIVFSPMDGSDHGATDVDEKRIYINTNFKEECQKETLLHELLHVAFMDCSLFKHPIDNDEDQEEFLIRYASPKLFQIFRDNAELREFIFG